MANSIYGVCRHAHDFGNWLKLKRRLKIFTNGQDFHCLPVGIALMQGNDSRNRRKFQQSFWNKKWKFILRN